MIGFAGPATAAMAANLPFPANGWRNPAGRASFEDFHFGSCDGVYMPGRAHLGSDSQGSPAGQAVTAIAAGTVVKLVATNWGPGGAILIEHVAGNGTHFAAIYGHINVRVSLGQTVSAGQRVGTVYDMGAKTHLHFGVRPLAPGELGRSVKLWGSSPCSGGSALLYGYVNPIPWLAAHPPPAAAALR